MSDLLQWPTLTHRHTQRHTHRHTDTQTDSDTQDAVTQIFFDIFTDSPNNLKIIMMVQALDSYPSCIADVVP